MATYDKPVTTGINNGGITDLGNGLMLYVGNGVFTTTGTTAVVYHPFGTGDIFCAIANPLYVSVDAQEQPVGFQRVTDTTANMLKYDTTYGTLKSNTAGTATVLRAASGESGLAFSIYMIGRSRH